MRASLRRVLVVLFVCAVGKGVAAQPPEGSQLAPDENACAMCHGEEDLWEEDSLHLYMPAERFADDIHWQKGVNCHDCHGGNPEVFDPGELHAKEDGFRELKEVWEACGNCHQDQAVDLRKGVHHKAGERDELGAGTPLACGKCHGEDPHQLFPVADARSPAFAENQVRICGGCHQEHLATYEQSTHGHGLHKSGLVVTAMCADCHGAHGIYWAADKRSTLHPAKVADTCGKCHRFIEERIQKSVHGRGTGPGAPADRPAPGGEQERKPSCTDCHQGHDLPHPEGVAFRLALPHRCGNCHPRLSEHYAMTLHAQLTELGYGPAANCSDCHGSHDILPLNDPNSSLAAGNRVKTCQKCHLHAVANFTDFDPHADHHDAENYPTLHAVYTGMEVLLYSVFCFFGIHSLLWFLRSLAHTLKHGRPKRLVPFRQAHVRFEPIHRMLHVIVIVSFLGLALTGLPLKYSRHQWAKNLAYAMGGFDSTTILHHVCAVATFFYFAAHLVWLAKTVFKLSLQKTSWKTIVFGPDSPVPNLRDVQDFFRMLQWFFGLGPKPKFERWTYWQKFDYWAVFWGVAVIGASGLILWFPNAFSRILPGAALNIAKVIHSEEALLATGFIFAIHFFHTHFRPEKFPLDMSVLVGLVTHEELREERPEFFRRLQLSGKLDESAGPVPSRRVLWFAFACGYVALLVGLGLLVGMVLASLSK